MSKRLGPYAAAHPSIPGRWRAMSRVQTPYERVQVLLADNLQSREEAVAIAANYRLAYERGWRASGRGTGLEAADRRGEPLAWYLGYHDRAAGRPKWAGGS